YTPTAICNGSTITMSDASSGGTWSSSTSAVAIVAPATGVVTALSSGVTTISYILGTGCSTTKSLTVYPLPTIYTITGGGSYCAGGPGMHVGVAGTTTGNSYQL